MRSNTVVDTPASSAKVMLYETSCAFSVSRFARCSAVTPTAFGLLLASLFVTVTPTN